MSYPSINRPLEAQGARVDAASDDQLRQTFIGACYGYLPLGYAGLIKLVEKMRDRADQAMLTLKEQVDAQHPKFLIADRRV